MRRSLAVLLLLCAAAARADDPETAKGFQAGRVYQFGDLANVNMYNGNLNIALPLGPSYPVSGHLSYSLTLAYSGNNWLPEQHQRTVCGLDGDPTHCVNDHWESSFTTSRRFNAGLGWMVSLGGLLPRGDTADNAADTNYSGYRSADAAEHTFTARDGDTTFTYTSDSTYLRMTHACGGACVDLEFPDGTIRRFNESDGQLTQIRDRFNNQVNVAYGVDPTSGYPKWTITDSTGARTHTVKFIPLSPGGTSHSLEEDPTAFYVVKEVDVATFNGGIASYVFHYDPAGDGVDRTTLISRRGPNQDGSVANTLWVPILRQITLPDNTSYTLTTDIGNPNPPDHSPPVADWSGLTGHLTALTLPTGGRYKWEYQRYEFSVYIQPPGPPGGDLNTSIIIPESIGLQKQVIYDRDDTKLSERDYDTHFLYHVQVGDAKVLQNTVTTLKPDPDNPPGDWIPDSKVINFFGAQTDSSPGPDYSLPFTREAQPDPQTASDVTNPLVSGNVTAYLSSKTYQGNHLLSASYLAYEYDPTPVSETHPNLRVKSRIVVTEPTTAAANASVTDFSDFDGYGHYRATMTSGSLMGDNTRTSITAFNKSDPLVTTQGTGIFDTGTFGASNFQLWPVDRPWILNLYTGVNTSEAGSGRRTLSSFNPNTGALERIRTLNNTSSAPAPDAHDLISVFTTDSAGNLTQEEYFGGDGSSRLQNTTLPLASVTPVGRDYVFSHSYSAGALAKTSYLNPACTPNCASFLDIVDRTNDPFTGLPQTTKDVAHLATNYNYDSLGRLTTITPVNGSWTTSYTYPTGTGVPTVTAETRAATNPDATKTLTSTYTYDGIGRLIAEETIGGATARRRFTKYDSSGRKQLVSTTDISASPTHFTTVTYDALDRLLSTTEPDGSTTTFDYTSEFRTTIRKSSIYTASGDTQAITREIRDHLNRLVKVIEPNAAGTNYTYDVADHLTSVTMGAQHRSFSYDGRGFLRTETHPELGTNGNGTTTYDGYDARGHATSKRTGPAGGVYDLTFGYDAAERLTTIAEPGHVLKSFTFGSGTGANPVDYHNGKLVTAVRSNHLPDVAGDVSVTETYSYGDTSGRPTRRDTTIQNPSGVLQSFRQEFTYDSLGEITGPGYPTCLSPVGCTIPSLTSVTNVYTNGLLTGIPNFATLSYGNNGTLWKVNHANNVIDTIAPDDNGMPRPKSIDYDGSTTCPPLDTPSITASSPVGCNTTGNQASVTSPVAGVTYSWGISGTGASINPPATGSAITYNAGTASSVILSVTASSSGSCSYVTANRTVTVTTASISQHPASTTISAGTSTQLSVIASGPNLHYQWYQGTPPGGTLLAGQTNSTFTTPALTQTTTYWVHITSDCGSLDSNPATVTVTIPAPTNFRATTDTPTVYVHFQWNYVSGASSYILEYATNVAGPYTQLGTAIYANDITLPLTPLNYPVAYVFRVWSAGANGVRSAVSNSDFAVTAQSLFTDEQIQKGVTRIKGTHIKELRDAIDALRLAATTPQNPLPPMWLNAPAPTGLIQVSNMTTLFAPLNAARAVFGMSAFSYQGVTSPATNGRILSEHIQQVRDSLR